MTGLAFRTAVASCAATWAWHACLSHGIVTFKKYNHIYEKYTRSLHPQKIIIYFFFFFYGISQAQNLQKSHSPTWRTLWKTLVSLKEHIHSTAQAVRLRWAKTFLTSPVTLLTFTVSRIVRVKHVRALADTLAIE